MSEAPYRHPADVKLTQVLPSPLPKQIRDVIAEMKGRPNKSLPLDYEQPKVHSCESNCMLLLPRLAKAGIEARIAYGVALLPPDWNVPSPERWRVHAWLLVGQERYDPTYEVAWKGNVSKVHYFEYSSCAYGDLPERVRKSTEAGWRQSPKLIETIAKLRSLGIDACLDLEFSSPER